MDEKDLKPNKQELAIMVNEMLNSPGWKIIEHWAYEQYEVLRDTLEIAPEQQVKDFQGQIKTWRMLFAKLKGYKDASSQRKE